MTAPDAGADSIAAEMFEIESWSDLVAAAPPPLAAATGLQVRSIGGAVCVIAPGIPSNEFNRCVGLGVERPASPADVDEILAFYRSHGMASAWVQLMDGAAPSLLPRWLAERGANPAGSSWAVFDRGLQPVMERGSGLRLAEIGSAHAANAAQVFRIGYGLPPAFDAWIAALAGRPRWRVYAAFDGEAVVATAFLRRSGARAIFAGAATLPEARGRGAQSGLMAMRVRDAASDGVTTVQSHTWVPKPDGRNPSLDNMRRSGFRELHRRTNFVVGRA
ncbi:MAG: GNAT family N-acetyltransferase [Rhizobiaceae bacterium]|nr:GNAT family N-acetyltransferase [Rhizobiaceae bacterium]